MRILHVTDRVTDRGGAHWHLRGVIESLVALGHEVHLAAGERDAAVQAPCPLRLVPGLEARGREPADLDGLVASLRPDVIHLHTIVNPTVLEWASVRDAVITVQDHRYFCPSQGKWTRQGEACRVSLEPGTCAGCFEDETYFRDVYALTACRLSALRRMRVIVLSRYMAGELEAAGVPRERLSVVPPFVHGLEGDDEENADDPCLLFVGRLTASKGVSDAIEAWRLSGLDLPLVVAGAGPLRPALESAGARVLGWVDHRRLSSLYRRAAAVLMPSRWQEPFGIAGLEALSLSTPVAAWASGGIPEWCPGPLPVWGDVGGVAAALRRLAGTHPSPPEGFGRPQRMQDLVNIYCGAA
jgi:glycosyltransferase involved in cell wall biosynthesis